MASKLITINRELSSEEVHAVARSGSLLKYMRTMVRDIRKQDPELSQYQLYDIGISRVGGRFAINLYFFS